LIAAFVGAVIGTTIGLLIEYLDNTIKSPQQIKELFNLPTIGCINSNSEIDNGVLVQNNPRSPTAEAFRLIRTNLEYTAVDHSINSILITSTGVGEGKTTTAIYLAFVMARPGKQVLLLDCDLRKPKAHKVLDLQNSVGISDVFRQQATLQDVMQKVNENLRVITSGDIPPNPAELLGSAKMTDILAQLKEMTDIVIVDSPPALVTDSSVLAAKTDAVVVVVQAGVTETNSVLALMDQLHRMNAYVAGIVLNKISGSRGRYYGYGYGYGYSDYDAQTEGSKKRWWSRA